MLTYKVFLDSACVNCKPNSILGSRVYKYLLSNGHTIEKSSTQADFIIINTCGFNEFHEKLSIRAFEKYSAQKKPGGKIISLGCLNRINTELIKKTQLDIILISDLTELDSIFFRTMRFAEMDEACISDAELPRLWKSSDRCFEFFDKLYLLAGKGLYLFTRTKPGIQRKIKQALDEAYKRDKFFVEIAQGCCNNCSYCVIKKARGPMKSRSIPSILKDVDRLYQASKNLYLVADDCGGYGLDIGTDLFSLLDAINSRYPGLGIDLCYINPSWLEKNKAKYLDLFKKVRINSVNISMQSGSDKIIGLMNRKYSVQNILDILGELREVSPQTLFWTHVMIGFPGETREDFQQTLSLVEHFDLVSKFLYSERAGTASVAMQPKIPRRTMAFRRSLIRGKEIEVYLRRFLKKDYTD
jgi:tRNA A37 methylthiotransferase MiaB